MRDTFVLIYFKMINHQSFQTRFHNSVKGVPYFKKKLRYFMLKRISVHQCTYIHWQIK